MNIAKDDILIRNYQDNPTVWVSERFLCNQVGDNISTYLWKRGRVSYKQSVPAGSRKKDILPATGRAWRYARINGRFYYDYDFIPNRKDAPYRNRLGDKDTLLNIVDEEANFLAEVTRKEAEEHIIRMVTGKVNRVDIEYYLFKEIDGVCKYNQDMARQLAEALNWLRFIRKTVDNKDYTKLNIKSQEDFLELCASILHRRKLYGFRVTTAGSLRKKLHLFPADEAGQYEYLVSGRMGNDNARKLGKNKLVDTTTGEIYTIDTHQAVITDLWMNPGEPGKGSKVELWEQYKQDIVYMGYEPLSYSTFCHYTNMYDTRFKTAKERHGIKYFNSTYLPYVSGEKPVQANSLWCADGSGTIGYQYIDRQGKQRAMRLYVMLISDVATGKIVGWCPSGPGQHSESDYMLRNAMQMALEGCGRREVMEFISDNGSAFSSAESQAFLDLTCRYHRSIKPGNSQANYAETQFRLFKKRFRRLTNWMGTSWDAKNIENQNNDDYTNIDTFPSYDEAVAQLAEKIEEWNSKTNRTGVSRNELYAENLHPDCQEIDGRIWRRLFGRYSNTEITRQRGTITVESRGEKCKFDIPSFEALGEVVQAYLGYAGVAQTDVYWDDECADVYTEDGRYMFSCYSTPLAATAHIEASDESMAALGKAMIRKAKTSKKVSEFTEQVAIAADFLYSEHPETYGNVCRQTKRAKERSNGEREAFMEAKLLLQKQQQKQQKKEAEKEAQAAEAAYEEFVLSDIDFEQYK